MKKGKWIRFDRRESCGILLGTAIAFMFCLFAPLDAFFANRDEFWFSLSQLLPMLAVVFVATAAVLSVFTVIVQRTKAAPYVYGFLLYVYLFFYIQGNYIPRNYGVLNGTEINWSEYGFYGILSIALAAVCVLLWIVSFLRLKDRIYKVGKYLCVFIMLIQLVTVGAVWIQNAVAGEEHAQNRPVVTNKDMLDLSKDNNVLIFLLDTFDAQDMLDLLEGEDGEEYRELFGGGFTFYPDTLGAYPTTKAAVPQILTGAWYYNDKPYAEYIQDAYRESPVLESLREGGYSVGLYTEDRLLNEDSDMYINVNAGAYYVKDYPLFAAKIFRLVAFNYMPHQLKRFFNMDTGEFEEFKDTLLEGGAYTYEVQPNYAYLSERGVSADGSGNCFRFYHTAGVHPQYTFGKDLVTEAGRTYDVYDEAQGNCTYLKTFFDGLREKGIYDSSTIVIMADHGRRDYSQNPLFMIKNAGDTEGFAISEEKMSFAYLPDIFISLIEGEKVTEAYIQSFGEQERRYLYYTWDDSWGKAYLPRMQEMYADGYAGDADSLHLTGKEYIGRDNYTYYGDTVSSYKRGDLIETVFFGADRYNADRYVVRGISGQEEWGSWTEGDEMVLSFPFHNQNAPFIAIKADIYSVFYRPQPVTVLVNGTYVYEDTVAEGQNLEFAFENPGTDTVELTFLLPDSISPSQVAASEDDRDLALGIKAIEVSEAVYEVSQIPDDGIIRFNAREYNANSYVTEGISSPEEKGAWTRGEKLLMYFALSGSSTADTVSVSVDLEDVAGKQQEIWVEANGEKVFDGPARKGDGAVSFEIPRPEDGIVRMTVWIPGAASPAEPGYSDGSKECGLMIKNLKFLAYAEK